jgi:putative thioredoxin
MSRTHDADPQAARSAAAASGTDVAAQLAVADLDVLGGAVEDAFARLLDTLRVSAGADRDALRERLVELFDVVGAEDPRVVAARRALAAALY